MQVNRLIRLSPVIWIFGLSAVAYQFLVVAEGLRRLRHTSKAGLIGASLIAFIAVYALSLFLATIRGEDIGRVIAGLYNLSIWIMGFFVVLLRNDINADAVRRAANFILCLTLILTIVSVLFLSHRETLVFPSLLALAINTDFLPANLSNNTTLTIFIKDWSAFGFGLRPSILSPYPTAFADLIFILACLAWPHERSKLRLPFFAIFLPLSVLTASALAASRAVAATFFVYFFVLLYSTFSRSIGNTFIRIAFYLISFSVFLVAGFLFVGSIASLWEAVNAAREGSSALRFLVYQHSITEMLNSHPLIGFGIKARDEYAIPIGSHSTFVGVLYKTGVIGFIAVSMFVYVVLLRTLVVLRHFRSNGFDRSIATGATTFFVAMSFGDIDAQPLVGFLYFVMLAIVLRRSEELQLFDKVGSGTFLSN